MRLIWSALLQAFALLVPAVALHLVEHEKDTQTVLLMQGERRDGHLKYLYEPVMTTLRLGFEGNPTRLNVITPPPGLDYRGQLRKHMTLLKRGDLLVWLGQVGSPAVSASTRYNFASLRDRGVKIVYYQSEPMEVCALRPPHIDELWDFSWHNIDRCKQEANAPVQRYVPLAAFPTPVTRQKDNPGALLFFGGYAMPCWKNLKQQMGDQLEREYGAWDDGAYGRVLDKHNIYLNLHKGACTGLSKERDAHNPITWRNAKLLNAHALIISQRAYPQDEEEFKGLVDFVDLSEIPERYRQLANMDAPARQKIADERARLFSDRFQPRRIFERAGVYGNVTRL